MRICICNHDHMSSEIYEVSMVCVMQSFGKLVLEMVCILSLIYSEKRTGTQYLAFRNWVSLKVLFYVAYYVKAVSVNNLKKKAGFAFTSTYKHAHTERKWDSLRLFFAIFNTDCLLFLGFLDLHFHKHTNETLKIHVRVGGGEKKRMRKRQQQKEGSEMNMGV